MIRCLLRPEDHRDPYVWAAVLLAHAFIGVVLGSFVGVITTAIGYALFELFQMIRSKKYLVADAIVDFGAVTMGAMFIHQPMLVLIMLSTIAVTGIRARIKKGRV